MNKDFPLRMVVVSVNTVDGVTHIEDWNPRHASKAKVYAAETAQCGDVVSVSYYNARSGESLTYSPNSAQS